MTLSEAIRSSDWVLTGTSLLLVLLGFVMLLSTTSDTALISSRVIRQAAALGIALIGYFTISLFPYHRIRQYAIPLFIIGLVVMIGVSQVAPVIRGATSRIEIGDVQIQPSEFMKIALLIMLAWYMTDRPASIKTVAISGSIVSLAVLIIALEPDVGVAALMAGTWLGLMIYLGISWRLLSLLSMSGVGLFWVAWKWFFQPYQKTRIATFLDPTADPLGAGYNITQSIVALGSGGLFGRGLGHGPQSQLKFLPEQHTDFILASIGEELGFIGILLLLSLYVIMLWRILKITRTTKDPFGQFLASGIFFMLLISLAVSAGMNMGILPVTGVPLPLVSYGGSNLVSTLVLLGLVQSVNIYSTFVRNAPSELVHFT